MAGGACKFSGHLWELPQWCSDCTYISCVHVHVPVRVCVCLRVCVCASDHKAVPLPLRRVQLSTDFSVCV